ncbi:MAG TPA: MFS transporter [Acidimicrobiales bacterium]|nr:MFS transporter [Acidimicrobiales bacterium]
MSPRPSTWPVRRWAALATLCLIQLMVVVDVTVVSIALPQAQGSLAFTLGDRQWVLTAYALAFGSLLLLGGRLSDVWGRRPSLIAGLVGFALASALGGDAHSFSTLVTARALQGVFAALLAPAALASLSDTFTDSGERARAFTAFGAVTGSGAAVGLILGGALTQWATWRWCLEFNLVVAALAIVGVVAWVDPTRAPRRANLDALGTLLSAGGLFLVVYGFSAAVNNGWGDESTWGSLVGGIALLVAFVAWQRRAPSPLLPLRLLLARTRGGSQVALFATSLAVFSLTLFLAYYLENTLGYSPLRTGVYFLPLVGALAVSASVASARLLAMVGPRPLVPVGMLLGMLGMALFSKLTPGPDYVGSVLPGLILTGLGLGLIIAPATASATSGVDRRDAGAASALVNTAQQVGASIGTALLNTIAVTVTARYVRTAGPSASALTAGTIPGYRVAFWWAAGIFGAGAVASAVLLESGATRDAVEAEPAGA